ncbi:hypothetical protein J1605_003202 [Eschrichtius robustus]|uniref:Uncharacterized protein n=1 Tax=Eschrichtius robustus TaxID=9764 RepID=A0AB34HSX3_ESCRO|nr:hypothetical protein J1605_003202 [Eschrichtius robustus]
MDEDDPHAEGAAVVAAAGEALQALCQELNLDEGSAAEALDDFTAIRGNYSLEMGKLSPEEVKRKVAPLEVEPE